MVSNQEKVRPTEFKGINRRVLNFKGIISKHFNLRVKQYNKQFKVIADSKIIRNYIVLKTVE